MPKVRDRRRHPWGAVRGDHGAGGHRDFLGRPRQRATAAQTLNARPGGARIAATGKKGPGEPGRSCYPPAGESRIVQVDPLRIPEGVVYCCFAWQQMEYEERAWFGMKFAVNMINPVAGKERGK